MITNPNKKRFFLRTLTSCHPSFHLPVGSFHFLWAVLKRPSLPGFRPFARGAKVSIILQLKDNVTDCLNLCTQIRKPVVIHSMKRVICEHKRLCSLIILGIYYSNTNSGGQQQMRSPQSYFIFPNRR